MVDCVQFSREFGQQLAKEVGVPVYLYENSFDKSYTIRYYQISEKGV